jgi:hypothetical protein
MTVQIKSKIVAYHVVGDTPAPPPAIEIMHEKIVRPAMLSGATYKIKTPLSDHALYVTINNLSINGKAHPFEIFINSKAMEHFQWIVALTRVISAVFRKGGDVTFLVEEMRSVFDPKGGYFKKGGKYMPSLVAEIGGVIEQHLIIIGALTPDTSRADAAKAMLVEKGGATKEATPCGKCNEVAVVMLDGCLTCTNCGDSKCG